MKAKLLWLVAFCLFFGANQSAAQQTQIETQGPTYVGTATSMQYVPSLASRSHLYVQPEFKVEEMQDGRAAKYDIVPGKGTQPSDIQPYTKHELQNKVPGKMPELVFETGASGSQPTDPAGAVGPNHYLSVINTAFQVFDKNGNSISGGLIDPVMSGANPMGIFPTGGCCDLTASYDNNADRWVVSMLGGGVQVAVSDGPDPWNDGWFVYTYNVVNDYQKLSVWTDGYYMTENTGSNNKVHVFERDEMILGNPGAGIQSFALPGFVTPNPVGFHGPQVFNLTTDDAPVSGATVVYFTDDSWAGVSDDQILLWDVNVDWATPANSNVTGPTILGPTEGVTPFLGTFDAGSFSNLTQPGGGTDIDALQNTMMNQAQFRKFPTYNSALFNFTIDMGPSMGANELAAIRWYELRQTADGQPWTVHQEGTYISPDNKHAWNASLAMDVQGNIGLGYTAMSSAYSADPNVRVGSYYTGRFAADPSGVMTVAEETIIAGNANIPGTRYGDYSKIDVDPANDKKFWYVNEVMSAGRKNVAGVFQLAPNTNDDVGVISVDTPTSGALTAAETITVTVFNFGENEASGFNVNYQVDGGATITEAFAGTIASQTSAQHVFTTTADLSSEGTTYSITSCTDYTIDEDTTNDCITVPVTHILANDIGVTEITSPVSGEGLTSETVTVTIENFGTADQSGFDVQYTINGGAPVVETVAATVTAGNTISYSFTTLADLSEVGDYTFVATTLLGTDSDNSNDSSTTEVTNVSCQSQSDAPNAPIGPNAGTVTTSTVEFTDDFVIDDVNVTLNITHTWNADMDVRLIAPDGTTSIFLFQDIGGSSDNFTNTVLDDEATTPISSGSAPYTGSFQPQESLSLFDGLQSIGTWTLEITDDANGDSGTLIDWTLQLCGNTNLSVDDVLVEGGLDIIYEDNNQFLVKLDTNSITERLHMNVYNTLGQRLLWTTLENTFGNGYQYRLDMSNVSAGVYFVKIGNGDASNLKRIIVE